MGYGLWGVGDDGFVRVRDDDDDDDGKDENSDNMDENSSTTNYAFLHPHNLTPSRPLSASLIGLKPRPELTKLSTSPSRPSPLATAPLRKGLSALSVHMLKLSVGRHAGLLTLLGLRPLVWLDPMSTGLALLLSGQV